MYLNRKQWGFKLYLILSGIFIASIVTCNLIFQKFFYWSPFQFLLNDGISPVLITDQSDKDSFYVVMPMKI